MQQLGAKDRRSSILLSRCVNAKTFKGLQLYHVQDRNDRTIHHSHTPPLGNPMSILRRSMIVSTRGPRTHLSNYLRKSPRRFRNGYPSTRRRFRPIFRHTHLAGTTSCLPSCLKDPKTATSTYLPRTSCAPCSSTQSSTKA